MSGSPLQRRTQCFYWRNELSGREHGFSECLGTTALARVINTSSMYIARNHAIKVPFQLWTSRKRVNQKALLDSGATECFIHPRVVARLQLTKRKLEKPRKVQNVNGTANKDREILEAVDLLVNNNGKEATHTFFVANIGQGDYILGYPFFEASTPNVDWHRARIEGITSVSMADASTWTPTTKGTRRWNTTPAWVRSIPGWEEGNEIWLQTRVAKTTIASELAQKATDKLSELGKK